MSDTSLSPRLLDQRRMHEIGERALALASADQTEVAIIDTASALTRFAENRVHQNVAEHDHTVTVRSIFGKRVGVATGNDLSEGGLQRIVREAELIARLQPENPEFPGLPGPHAVEGLPEAYVEATADCTPEQRADGVGVVLAICREHGVIGSGAVHTAATAYGIVNSLGTRDYQRFTQADFVTVVMAEDSSGYAAFASKDTRDFDFEALGKEAVDKAVRSAHPQDVKEDDYEVVLEPYAVAEMLQYLGYIGISAQAVQEGRSFLSGHMGERLAAESITLIDDGADTRGLPFAFDGEGAPKQRVVVFDHGVATAYPHDSLTAAKESVASTGHALPAPNTMGPFPLNLALSPGAATVEQMIKSVEYGIYVTRFHYVNPVHPLLTTLTGMTRDGTFLIEHGEITRPIKNFRFTSSILTALRTTKAVGSDLRLLPGFFGGVLAPALQVGSFTFTGATQF